MNASEIRFIEAKLQAGLNTMPSAEQLERLVAQARRQRNREMAASFGRLFKGLKAFANKVRKIAESCTDARLHHRGV